MTGFTFGQADDALEGFVWTECVLGRGYALLKMADREKPAQGWPKHSVTAMHPGATSVALSRAPAFAFAARLSDLARANAVEANTGPGLVEVSGAFGGWIAPYIAYRLGRANHYAIVLWLPGETAVAGEAPATLIAASAASGDTISLTIAPRAAYGLKEQNESSPAAIPRSLLEAIAKTASRTADCGMLTIAATSISCPSTSVTFGTVLDIVNCADLADAESGFLDGAGGLRKAIDVGIQVAPDDHRVMTKLLQLIRMPNTERSKSQAG
jgi:hypothetical protein